MKKIISCLALSLFVFSFYVSVNATTYSVKAMIPVDTTATVETESFIYQDFVYGTALDEKGQATINFSQITNRTTEKIPVSVNILLFNGEQNNIGYLTYCTDRDWDSDYNNYKIEGNQSIPFSIKVTSRYFGFKDDKKKDKYTPGDVKYIAVLDDNKYCRVGGYDNYIGKKLDQIVGTATNTANTNNNPIVDNSALISTIIKCLVGVVLIGIVVFLFKKFKGMIPNNTLPKKNEKEIVKTQTKDEVLEDNVPDTGNDVIDISYHGNVSLDDDENVSVGSSNTDDLFNISASETGDSNISSGSTTTPAVDESKTESKSDNNKEGESDLANFFK